MYNILYNTCIAFAYNLCITHNFSMLYNLLYMGYTRKSFYHRRNRALLDSPNRGLFYKTPYPDFEIEQIFPDFFFMQDKGTCLECKQIPTTSAGRAY